ncbi:MAG: hypothetical protein HYX27_13610 [Acidobacteria bacterium]|nr:hypothetical protein [Acidobacteriota bacterium]
MAHLWTQCQSYAGLLAGTAWGAAPSCPDAAENTAPAKLPKPSVWAEERFNFKPAKIQKQVLDAKTKRLILCCNRQWGKSTVIAIRALHHALEHPGCSIIVVSHTENQGGQLVKKVLSFASLLGLPDRRVRGQEFSLKLPNGAEIYAIAHSADSAPSRTADIVIYDEAARVSDTVFSATLPFIAHTGGAVWMLSTPNGQSGFFYNFWHDGDGQWTRIRSTVDDCPDITKEFLELHRKGTPQFFRQEFYCEFTPAPGRLISRERLQQMYDPALNSRKLPPLKRS